MAAVVRKLFEDVTQRRHRSRQAVGWTVTAILVAVARPFWWGFLAGAALMVVGAAIRSWAAGHVHKNQALATDGPYRLVRHPQYLGNCLLAAGLSLACGWPIYGILLWAVVFWLFYVPAIRKEDRKLSRAFGDDWKAWAARTPAVFPTRLPAPGGSGGRASWSLRQWAHNGEPIWLAVLTLGMVLVWLRLP